MRKHILFRNLWNGSTFIYNDRPFRKQSDARSVDLLNGKDSIFAGNDKLYAVPEKEVYKQFKIEA